MSKVLSKSVGKARWVKPRKPGRLSLGSVSAAVKALSIRDKLKLFDELDDETREARRGRFIAEVQESEAEYVRGEYFEGTAEEVLRELKR
jgi:hypothetical protein